ncbi:MULTISPECIES: transposase [Mycolicibacterium]|uniref:transposase n=1 Tax=Mycolicibacterium TaxID=1866885 RepID=UPI0030789142
MKLSDSEIQRRVITAAKTTEERAWLAEVPSVALVQSVNDSRRAWRNFFDSATGKRKGRRVGRPRFKSRKDHRQSFRLTRNGFSIRDNGRLFVAKVGDVAVRWSRELPSTPVRREFTGACVRARMRGHLWSPSYFAVSCGGAPLSIIKQYIDGQARPL